MDIVSLKYFVQAYKDKSITKASENLYITQQGLSKALKQLETEFGVPLFERSNQGLVPTDYGKYLYDNVATLIEEYEKIMEDFQKYIKNKKKTIRIGFAYGVMQALSSDIVPDFQKMFPNINVEYQDYTDEVCEEKLSNEELDLAFSVGPFDYDKFEVIKIMQRKFYFLVNSGNPLSKKKELTFGDVKNEKFLCAGKEFKTYFNIKKMCKKYGYEPNVIFTTNEVMVLKSAVADNKGISITLEQILKNQSEDKRVRAIPVKDEEFVWEVGLLHKKNKKSSSEEAEFIRYAKNLKPDLRLD